ncbi:uncharacterized protein LOC135691976 [Rhopilema esculentum]|uniref:uncharacterized protein LOC135691976 n=1 Tax=Rhopilema esculentum TaxID=499914 RepID=UPI0031E10934|eukprot:gene9399-17107_t
MTSESEEEIFTRYATNQTGPKHRSVPKKRQSRMKRLLNSGKRKSSASVEITPARVYLFNFFLFSSIGSLMPFMPVFFKLIGFSSLENGLLFAVRPLISFWWGPLVASFVTSSKFRQLILFTCVAGTVASTFCISVVRTNDGGNLEDIACQLETVRTHYGRNHHKSVVTSNYSQTIPSSLPKAAKESGPTNKTTLSSWKTYITKTSKQIYHQLEKGIVMKNLFFSVLVLTILSELFMSPTMHVSQASIKFKSDQPFFNSLCINRAFCRIGMTVAALSISFVAWKYRCTFQNVHFFYFHFYGFLATGCITALMSIILPSQSHHKTSFATMICNSFLTVVFDWNNFGYIFGLWIAGIAEGTINAYILWYAYDIGASELVIGILVALALFTDMVFHLTVGYSMKWIGHNGLLSVGIFLMAIQFFILTYVGNILYILPSQLLCGIASCCVRSSFIGCAKRNANKDMEKILFFVFQASYMGLGLGLGGIFVAIPYYTLGAQKTFSALSVLTLSYTCLYIIIKIGMWIKSPRKTDKIAYQKLNTRDRRKGDWLLDALQDEEAEEKTNTSKEGTGEEIFFMEEGVASKTEAQLDKVEEPSTMSNNNKTEEESPDDHTVT